MIREWITKLSMSQIRSFTKLYFTYLHPQYLILDEDCFYSEQLHRTLQNGFEHDIETCLVLLVLALGVMVSEHAEDREEWAQSEYPLGRHECELGLLSLASEIFRRAHGTDWTSIQCLLLMG